MLPKRSTYVDQNLGYESIHSKLSVAILTALKTHLAAQKCSKRWKKSKKGVNPWKVLLASACCAISRINLRPLCTFHGFPPFFEFFHLYRHFWSFRWVLGATNIATESLECVLSDPKFWSTGVDLLGNISTLTGTVHVKNGHDRFLKKASFWYLQVGEHENTIPDHYIVGNESYNTPLDFPKDTERNFNSETKFFKIFNFLSKNG